MAELTEAEKGEIKEALDAIEGARGDEAVIQEQVERIRAIVGNPEGPGLPGEEGG